MEDNGNKPRGIILILITLALAILIVYSAISLCLSNTLVTWGYKDPEVSTNNVRGTIYDRNGRILAIQAPNYGFLVSENNDVIQQLSSFISQYSDYDGVEIASKIEKGESFFPLSSSVTSSQRDLINIIIEENSLSPYLEFAEKETRFYPYKFSTDIIGNTSSPSKGIGGIEEMFNEYLMAVPEVGKTTVHGSSITLTLDSEIQTILEEIKKEMGMDNDVSIISNKGFIVAYDGDEDVLNDLVRFITPPSSVTTERAIRIPSRMMDGIAVGSYYVWSDSERIKDLAERVGTVLKKSGKI